MASFAGIVLLMLASSGSVLGQRKHGRNIQPVGADVKTGLNFDCPEEFGYYPHPADCTQYYVCVFGGALLESCTGGLMYSHELQTCDWPRNVGCDATGDVATTPAVTYSSSSSRTPESKVRYTHPPPPPPPAQPAAVVTSRGQPRQLHHNQQDLIKQKQQQQLYEDADDSLPPAEEIESDRQQRVYRGQPSTVGQVQRDRDGLRHHTNAIPSSSGRGEKIGVISFGTQQQPLQQYTRDLTDDDDILTNNLTPKLHKRYKRQIEQSRNHGVDIDSWRVVADPYYKLQRPASLNFQSPSLSGRSFGSTHKLNLVQSKYQSTESFQNFQPITATPFNYNRGRMLHNSLENSNPPLSGTVNDKNYQYFNFKSDATPLLTDLKTSVSNYSTYPYNDVNFSSIHSHQSTPVSNHQQNSNYFIPSIHFVLESQKYKMPSYWQPPLYFKTTPLHSMSHSRPSTITENNFAINKQHESIYKQGPAVLLQKQKGADLYHPYNYYSIYTFLPTKSHIKDTEQLHDTLVKLETMKEIVPYNIKTYDTENIKHPSTRSNVSSNYSTESSPENNTKQLYSKSVKSQSDVYDNIIQNKSKNVEPSDASLLIPRLTKLKSLNKTQLNSAHTDDVYYYYYDDEGDGMNSKTPFSTQSSLLNSNDKAPSWVLSENKSYYDEYYDYKEPNMTDYYYEDLNLPTKNYFNNSKAQTSTELTKSLLQPTIYPKIRAHSSTSKSTKTQRITGKLTTTTPSFTAHIRTSQLMSTTRPTTAMLRQRLTSTTRWYTNNDYTSNQLSVTTSRVESRSNRPVEQPHSTVAPKVVYNTSSHSYDSSRYDPYYALYDDDVDLYKDVEYTQHYNNEPPTSQQTYRGTPASSSQQVLAQEKTPKRGSAAYIQNSYSTPQDIYQSSAIQGYDDNHYSSQDDDRNAYHQTSKQTSRGDRNELNYIEESATTKRTTATSTTTTTTTTTVTTPRQLPTQKSTRVTARLPNSANVNEVRAQPTHYTLPEGPGYFHATLMPNNTGIAPNIHEPSVYLLDNVSDIYLQKPVVNQPAPFTFPKHLTTPKTSSFHYITKLSKSTSTVSTGPSPTLRNSISKSSQYGNAPSNFNNKIVVPTTYAPPIFFLKSLINTKLSIANSSLQSDLNWKQQKNEPASPYSSTRIRKDPKTVKTLRLRINPSTINNQLWSSTNETIVTNDYVEIKDSLGNISDSYFSNTAVYDKPIPSSTKPVSGNDSSSIELFNEADTSSDEFLSEKDSSSSESFFHDKQSIYLMTTAKSINTSTDPVITTMSSDMFTPESFALDVDLTNTSWLLLLERLNQMNDNKTISHIKVSEDAMNEPVIPKPLMDILHYESKLLSLEKQNSFMSNPAEDVTKKIINASRITSLPTRVSRVNAAIKSVIALGRPQRQYSKCNENQSPTVKCKKINQRINSRGRGSAHYSSSGPGEAIVVNRGTPPARSRPTLKPSTSIVSKAAEYIDIYKYPPHRPQPIYPQPQPDKTAAKCRKDVCLLPDCSCGGKDIPGDLDVYEVPQMVLLTFDDAVNDLNLPYYAELFENGRVNPNGCPIVATFYVSHEWTDYSQVQNLYADGHEMASHTVSHSFGEQFSQKKWTKEVAGQREILSAYGGVRLEDVRGMRAPFLSVGGNKMFKMLYDSNFTYDSSMPIYENKPPSWPYTLDYKLFHDCMIPPCPTRSYPGVWEVPMVMWQDLNGGRCSMGDACSNPADADGVYKMLMKNFERHYTTNRAPFGLFYHAAWFTQPHHKEGFIQFLDAINSMKDVWLVTNWQAIQWVRDPTPVSRLSSFQPFGCNYSERPKRCNNPKVCNLWHKTGVRYMRTCQPCPDIYPWTGNTGIRSSRIDNELED